MNIQHIITAIIALITVILFTIYLVWQIKKKGLKRVTINMIIKAENLYEKGQNSEKMQYVINEIKQVLQTTIVGKVLSIFITEQNIRHFIQKIFDNLKKALDYIPKTEGVEKDGN